MKKFLLIMLLITLPVGKAWLGYAQSPTVTPIMEYTDAEGTITQNTTYSGNAPFKPEFLAQVADQGNYSTYFEWKFYKEGETEPFLVRYDENTEYEFVESGTFRITFFARFINGKDTIEYNPEDYESQNLTVSIATSILQMPNTFTPNGDDYNEYYQAKKNIQSIVEFRGIIFNRWGEKIYEWTDPYTKEAGWDGTYHGQQMPQGVYFCRVDAKGADGVQYHIKKDVNLLRDYEEAESSSTTDN